MCERGESPVRQSVVATILLVAITVTLTVTLWVMVSGIGIPDAPKMVGVVVKDTPDRTMWQLQFVVVPANTLRLDALFLQLAHTDGQTAFARTPLSNLTGNVILIHISNSTYLQSGDSILINKTLYPRGTSYLIVSASDILAQGVL